MSPMLWMTAAAPLPQSASGSLSTWMGGFICLIFWIFLGWKLAGSSQRLRERLTRVSRGKRVFLGSGGLILGLVLLLGGMVLIGMAGGADEHGIKPGAWPLIFILGLIFVQLQVVGAAAMMTLIEDSNRPKGPGQGQEEGSEKECRETTLASPASEPSEPRS